MTLSRRNSSAANHGIESEKDRGSAALEPGREIGGARPERRVRVYFDRCRQHRRGRFAVDGVRAGREQRALDAGDVELRR